MTLHIDYESDGFAVGGLVANGMATLNTSWDDLLWAAVTVGRPNRQYVFRHGRASMYEALFRWSLVRMSLEQTAPTATRLRRTAAARTLDPSEKGAVNYFLGLTICKLFSAKLLNAPWLLHLDVFRPYLNPVLTGRSRPDLLGRMRNGDWVALECKGRVSAPNASDKNKAKQQAQRLINVNGAVPLQIGGISYFKNEVLRFFWRDPEPDPERVKRPIEIRHEASDLRYHYAPILDLIRPHQDEFERMLREPVLMPVENLDIKIGIHPKVLKRLIASQWEDLYHIETLADIQGYGLPYQSDGIAVVAGESWLRPFNEAATNLGF